MLKIQSKFDINKILRQNLERVFGLMSDPDFLVTNNNEKII